MTASELLFSCKDNGNNSYVRAPVLSIKHVVIYTCMSVCLCYCLPRHFQAMQIASEVIIPLIFGHREVVKNPSQAQLKHKFNFNSKRLKESFDTLV